MASVAHSNVAEIGTPPTPHHVDRTLKRSASTASLLSPPASVRKPRASKRLRTERAVDSDDESDHGDYLHRSNKAANRPKTRSMKGKGVAIAVPVPVAAPAVRKRLEFVEPHAEKDQDQDEDESGAGPRPKTPVRVCVPPPVVAPQTPPRTVTRKGGRINRDGPLRDSPNNPFLMECPAPAIRPRPKRSAADFTEGPTVGYVFRGVPTTFANPYANQRPPSPTIDRDHPSFLPLEHPDFSPSELTRPKLLFPEAHGYAVDGDGSPRAREPPSTPRRGRPKAPRTPTRRSKRKVAEDVDQEPIAGPSSKRPQVEPVSKTPEPRTPGPKTPQRRGRTRTTVITTTTVSTTAVPASSGTTMMTRSKKIAEARK